MSCLKNFIGWKMHSKSIKVYNLLEMNAKFNSQRKRKFYVAFSQATVIQYNTHAHNHGESKKEKEKHPEIRHNSAKITEK